MRSRLWTGLFASRPELSRLHHLFQRAETGAIEEDGFIEESFAPEAMALIGEWIEKRFGPVKDKRLPE